MAVQAISKDVVRLGPWDRRYTPAYQIDWYRDGNPAKVIHGEFDTTSIVSIETSKNITNISGTFRIVLKDARAEHAIAPMDVAIIKLKGHNVPLTTVLHGVVDNVEKEDAAELESASENTVIEGRCMGKYLQINSLFLPVWETQGLLPTALTFGLGDSTEKAGTTVSVTVPKEIFGYVYRRYIVGESKRVGISGTPAAKHWLNKDTRFEEVKVKGEGTYHVPYIQFDENTTDQVLTALTITGFTEGWVDEFGYVVYRPPGWDLPVNYVLSTEGLLNDQLGGSDVGLVTYVEVVPSGALGISTAAQQATAAGRAPMPSNYHASITGTGDEGHAYVDKEFVIDANGKGEVTKKGAENYWYRRQRKYGLRPYQVTSPLLVSQAQAQAQAQGLLKFLGNRLTKTGTVTIPGEPNIRLGTTILIKGTLRGKKIERTFYIEGVSHEYIDGQGYKTTLELTHGRDPWDPEWKSMVLAANPSEAAMLAEVGGVSEPNSGAAEGQEANTIPGESGKVLANGEAVAPAEAPRQVRQMLSAGNEIRNKPYVYGGGHGQSLETPAQSYDCSSSVDYLLFHAGLIGNETPTSGDLEGMFESGPGKWVTIYANAEHVWMVVAGISWDHSEGHWYQGMRGDGNEDLSRFVVRHPKGF
jgi:hypothetical protein